MDTFVQHYADFYGDPKLRAWRDTGALDKAANVIRLWRRIVPGDGGGEGGGGSDRGVGEGPAIADIGCGDGAVTYALSCAGFGARYVGFEVSASGIAAARARDFARPFQGVLYDGDRLPARDGAFDLAILSHVVEHVESPRPLIREAARIARHVFVEVPLERHWRTPPDFRWTSLGHVNLYDALTIRHLVQSAGLEVLAQEVTCPSRAVMTHDRPGLWHMGRWAAMEMLIRICPSLAQRLWTYHASLLARSSTQPGSKY